MPFQNAVNQYNPPAVAGDFATANPRVTAFAPEGAFVAGPGGVTVGRFVWLASDGRTVNNFATGAVKPLGFIHRDQQALITQYLAESSNVIPPGFPVTVHSEGDFFATIKGGSASTGNNDAVYANYADGSINIASAPSGFSATGSVGATFTATGAANQLTVTAVTGLISVGDTISGTGVPAGTTILNQVSGTTGGAGVYTTSNNTTAAAATVTSFGVVLNVSAVASGTLNVGDALTGTGIPSGATIASQVSGAVGGVGVYTLDIPATAYAASTALTGVGGILTSFTAKSAAAVGALAVISTW